MTHTIVAETVQGVFTDIILKTSIKNMKYLLTIIAIALIAFGCSKTANNDQITYIRLLALILTLFLRLILLVNSILQKSKFAD